MDTVISKSWDQLIKFIVAIRSVPTNEVIWYYEKNFYVNSCSVCKVGWPEKCNQHIGAHPQTRLWKHLLHRLAVGRDKEIRHAQPDNLWRPGRRYVLWCHAYHHLDHPTPAHVGPLVFSPLARLISVFLPANNTVKISALEDIRHDWLSLSLFCRKINQSILTKNPRQG